MKTRTQVKFWTKKMQRLSHQRQGAIASGLHAAAKARGAGIRPAAPWQANIAGVRFDRNGAQQR